MIEKALIIIIFMYVISLSLVGIQIGLGDTFGITLVSPITGEPIDSAIRGYINEEELNQRTANIVAANFTSNSTFYDRVETFTTGAAFVAWELVTLLSGTYIFYIMVLMGVPIYFVGVFVTIYIFLLARAIIGLIRGI